MNEKTQAELDKISKEINRIRLMLATYVNELDVQAGKLEKLLRENNDGKD